MAKSTKKSEANEKKPAATKTSGKPADAKPQAKSTKPVAARAPQSKPTVAPLIDTSFVASSAARMLVAGLGAKNQKQPTSQSNKPESSLFKQMKSGLNKPHSAQMDSLLDKTHGPGAQKTQGGFEKQVAHNQTVGSDATRKSVPRRTAG